ncbi:hypothetical protein D3C80_1862940 [compost metagenome]
MADECEDKGAADNVARQRRNGERIEKFLPGESAAKHQIQDLDRADHDMGQVANRHQIGHQHNYPNLGRPGGGEHPHHGGDDPARQNAVGEHF